MDHIEVRLIHWPAQADELANLAVETPRLLLVDAGAPPPEVFDPFEDWIRLPADPIDLPEVATALADFAGCGTDRRALIDQQAAAVSVPAPDGVSTLGEVFRRLDGLGIELADISFAAMRTRDAHRSYP